MKRALHLVQRALHVLQIFLQLWWDFLFFLRPFSWKGPYMLCKVIPSKPRRTQCVLKRALLVLQFFPQDSKMQHFRTADTMSFCDSFQNSRYDEFSSYLLFIFKKLSSLIVSATHFRIADFFVNPFSWKAPYMLWKGPCMFCKFSFSYEEVFFKIPFHEKSP